MIAEQIQGDGLVSRNHNTADEKTASNIYVEAC